MAETVVMGMVMAGFLLLLGVGLFTVGKACENGDIARNRALGLRTRHTLASDEAWRVGHVAGGRSLKIAGLGMLIGSALAVLSAPLFFLGVSENVTNSIIASLIIASALWSLIWVLLAGLKANRVAKQLSRSSEHV